MPRIITICQPRYLPAANLIHRMALCDVFVYLDQVKYSANDYENRNKVKTANGSCWLTVPVLQADSEQLIGDTQIDYRTKWQKKHIETIRQNYRKAVHFDAVFPELEKRLSEKHEHLSDLSHSLVRYFVEACGIDCEFKLASELSPEGSKQDLLMDICQRLDGDVYISGALGRNYIDDDVFAESNLGLYYHDYVHPEYSQGRGEFLPWMSFVDMLLHCGPNVSEVLQRGNATRDDLRQKFTQ